MQKSARWLLALLLCFSTAYGAERPLTEEEAGLSWTVTAVERGSPLCTSCLVLKLEEVDRKPGHPNLLLALPADYEPTLTSRFGVSAVEGMEGRTFAYAKSKGDAAAGSLFEVAVACLRTHRGKPGTVVCHVQMAQ